MTAGGFGSDGGGGRDSRPSLPPPTIPPETASRNSVILVPTAPPSRTLGRYELLIPIAEGGMASIWAARMKGQRGFQKIVAIKQMRPELTAEENFETMFLDEAALVSRLKHPNLAEILDLGEEDDQLYQVMEFVDGEPLNRLIRQRRGALPVPLAILICKEVCAGLHAAHELKDENGELVGLVHRDISLQNILVTYDGVTKVIDFGVAKAISNQQKTSIGQVKGKVPYMSPEQAIGDPVDRRTDIFALGIVLYQLITAKHPFRGETELETMMHICDKKPVAAPSTIVPSIPRELDAVVQKALEKNKENRYGTMSEFLRGLEASLPPGQQATTDDLAKFMQATLGTRGEQRRHAIQEAGRLADLSSSSTERRPPTIPPSTRAPSVAPPPRPPGHPGYSSHPGSAGPASVSGTLPPASAPASVTSTSASGISVNSVRPPPSVAAPSVAPAPRTWRTVLAGSSRTVLLIAIMGAAGVGIGLGAVSILTPDSGTALVSEVPILYPALGKVRLIALAQAKVRAAQPQPPASSSATPSGAPSSSSTSNAAPKSSSSPKKTPSKTPTKTKIRPIF